MKGIIINKNGKINYSEVKEPTIKKGWAKVKVIFSGLCGSDTQKIFSDNQSRKTIKSKIWGHEFSGIIKEIGKNNKFKTGDRVAVMPLIFNRSKEITKSKSIGKDYDGGFSEFCLVPIKNLIKLPKDLSFELASLTDVIAMCIHAYKLSQININSKILIIGDGAVGLSMALVCKNFNNSVYLSGKNKKNLGVASEMGIRVKKKSIKNFNEYDYIFEAVGRKQDNTLSEAINLILPKGKIIVLGVFERDYVNKLILRNLFFKEAEIVGLNSYNGMEDFEEALNIILKNSKEFQKIITHKFPLYKFNDALKIFKNKKEEVVIKILFFNEDDKNNNL